MRKFIKCFVLFCWISRVFSQSFPILDPDNPEFAWMDKLIEADFSTVNSKISAKEYKRSISRLERIKCVCRFRVIDNQVQGPPGACYNMLEYLCKVYGLPDLDFLYWNADGPAEKISKKTPVLTGARNWEVSNSILFNDWLFDINNPGGPWHLEKKVIDETYPVITWSLKKDQMFWRGAGSDIWSGGGYYSCANWADHSRGKACALSLQSPELIDAAFTYFIDFFCEGGESEVKKLSQIAPMGQSASLKEHLKYKYQLQISGCMGNFPRDRWQFYSGCVTFRHPPPHEMFWYSLLEPWQHYIPIESSMSDLIDKIKWAQSHDKKCQQIAENARHFAKTHFMPEHIALYSYKVLLRYAKIQNFNPKKLKIKMDG